MSAVLRSVDVAVGKFYINLITPFSVVTCALSRLIRLIT